MGFSLLKMRGYIFLSLVVGIQSLDLMDNLGRMGSYSVLNLRREGEDCILLEVDGKFEQEGKQDMIFLRIYFGRIGRVMGYRKIGKVLLWNFGVGGNEIQDSLVMRILYNKIKYRNVNVLSWKIN